MITVLLATRNGGRTLPRTLEAFARLERPRGDWRMIAIDNGSRDNTPAVLDSYRRRLPLTILHEPRAGKSVALNRALPLVEEGLAVFVDDDILPAADWVRAYESAAAANPGSALFAGRILPCWDAEPPPWLLDCAPLDVCFGIHGDIAEGPCPYHLLYGGNMAIRAEALRRGHRFGEHFGPDGSGRFAMGGETEFVRVLAEQGHVAWFCRGASVRHIVPPEHMTLAWLLNRAVNYGRGRCLVGGDPLLPPGSGASVRRSLRRAIIGCRWRALRARLRGDDGARFRALWRLNYVAGLAAQYDAARPPRQAEAPLRHQISEPRDAQ